MVDSTGKPSPSILLQRANLYKLSHCNTWVYDPENVTLIRFWFGLSSDVFHELCYAILYKTSDACDKHRDKLHKTLPSPLAGHSKLGS